jgi:hypothetical protein
MQVSSLQKKGVSAQAINSETLATAAVEGRDIWAEAKTGKFQILLFSPETTATDEFDELIKDEVARPRIGYFVVDEIPSGVFLGKMQTTFLARHRTSLLMYNTCNSPNSPLLEPPSCHRLLI